MTTLIDKRRKPIDVDHLVEANRVHRAVYTDPAIFDLEMERIWGTAWIYVGHESQIAEPGQYYATMIGKQPVVLVRDRNNAFHVLFNRCAHKGALLVGDREGKLKEFRCCYHGWRFDLDGRLLSIPLEQGYDGTGFGRDDDMSNMQPVARYESYRGFVFASLSPDGPDLATWLGGAASSIDNMVDRSPEGALEVAGGVMRYEHDCNWKFFVENLNDMMHPMVAHQSSSLTARVVAKKELDPEAPVPSAIEIIAPFTESYTFFDEMGVHAFDYGHGYSGGKVSIHAKYSDIPEYNARMEKAYGKDRFAEIMTVNRHNTIFYPSATIKGAIQTMRVVRPVAVDKTIIESWTFRLKGAPDEVLQRSILYCNLINSSANLVGPDDQESYRRQQTGLESQGSDWITMHRDFGRDEDLGGGHTYAKGSSDISFRNQYKAWKSYMSEGGR
jgi:phenylpropionate dioxygenase-like ring-hydroxylating dioxygenase large terminal subunit